MQVILIGVGEISKKYYKAFKKANITVSALVDVNTSPLGIKNYPNIPFFNYLHEVLNIKANTVIISTPPYTHYKLIKEALLLGYNVIVEKPGYLNVKEMDELKDIARSKSLYVKTMLHWLYGKENIFIANKLKDDNFDYLEINVSEPYAKDLKTEKEFYHYGGVYVDGLINILSFLSLIINVEELNLVNKEQTIGQAGMPIKGRLEYNYKNAKVIMNYNWTLNKKTKITNIVVNNNKYKINHNLQRVYLNNEVIYSSYYKNRLEDHYLKVFKHINDYNYKLEELLHKKLFEVIK